MRKWYNKLNEQQQVVKWSETVHHMWQQQQQPSLVERRPIHGSVVYVYVTNAYDEQLVIWKLHGL